MVRDQRECEFFQMMYFSYPEFHLLLAVHLSGNDGRAIIMRAAKLWAKLWAV